MKKEPSPLWQYHATFNPGKPFLGCSAGALNSKAHDANPKKAADEPRIDRTDNHGFLKRP